MLIGTHTSMNRSDSTSTTCLITLCLSTDASSDLCFSSFHQSCSTMSTSGKTLRPFCFNPKSTVCLSLEAKQVTVLCGEVKQLLCTILEQPTVNI